MQRLSTSRLARLTAGMAAPVERGEIPGLVALVARGEDVHVEVHGKADLASGAPMRRDTIFRIASVSKPITAVAAMMLVEEAILRLDEPVTTWLPELADITVLRRLDGPIDDVVSAARAITVRDLLTFRMGLGAVMAAPGTYPIQAALAQASLAPGPSGPQITPDAWIAGLGRLPLIHQPGEQWMYHTGSDVLGLLIARASGMSLGDFLRRRLFEPLGMKDTGFSVPAADIGRLSTAYVRAPGGGFEVFDPAVGGQWSKPPIFESAGGGLVSTADDLLAFSRMLLNDGRAGGEQILARPSITMMTTDHITPEQKARSAFWPGFWDTYGWGFGMAVVTRRPGIADTPGAYGWDGGTGTTWRNDPAEDMTTIFLSQRLMRAPDDTQINDDFRILAYQAMAD